MRDEMRPFIDAITANPAEDAPRLVFADWLEERGETGRSEFIRVQIELAKLPKGVDDPRPSRTIRLAEMLGRERELWKWLKTQKRHPWHDGLDGFAFGLGVAANPRSATVRRGFVSSIRCTLADWCGERCERCSGEGCSAHSIAVNGPCGTTTGHAGEICLHHPIESVTLTDRRPQLLRADGLSAWNASNYADIPPIQSLIPHDLWGALDAHNPLIREGTRLKVYPTEADALAALDRAAVKLGREQAEALRRARR